MDESDPIIIGRYALFDELASGGMATVHLGRLVGAAGFSRLVAIKRLHRQFAKDPEFVSMFIDEARLAARIRHPNVVPTLDVVQTDDELFLVMEYVQGESLAKLLHLSRRRGEPPEPAVAVAIAAGMLHGLHAAHTAKDEKGVPLHIVHRDVSPQNVIVGTDGVARVLDFGIAKATVRLQTTRDGQIKGKLAYMAPEQLAGGTVGPFTDVYAASLVLWEALANERLFEAEHEAALLATVLGGATDPPSAHTATVPPELDELVMRGLGSRPEERFESARDMALALERAVAPASAADVGAWVEQLATSVLSMRAERISIIESESQVGGGAELTPSGDGSASGEHPAASGETPDSEGRSTRVSGSHSQMSSISVARSQSELGRRSPPARYRQLGLAALAVLVGGLLALALIGGPSGPSAESAGAETAASAPASPTGPAAPTASTAPAPSSPSAAPSTEPTAAATASAAATATAPAVPRPAPRPRPRPTTAPGPAPKPTADCSPPYTVDADGIRHIKPHCVR